jgi:hypothetical protein
MKKFIALMLACGMAHGGTVFISGNKDGKAIRFTDEACVDRPGTMIVYTTNAIGKVLSGCYAIDDDLSGMIVRWEDGDVFRYEMDSLTVTPYGMEKWAKPQNDQQL